MQKQNIHLHNCSQTDLKRPQKCSHGTNLFIKVKVQFLCIDFANHRSCTSKIVIYGQVYWQNKNEGWQNQESEGFYVFIRLFWEFYGQWGVLMCCRSSLSSFFCEGPGFYFGEVRPKAEPNQNKTLAPNKKKLDKLLRQHIRTSKLPWNPQKSLMTT